MDSDENRSAQNLILMCIPHAAAIDEPGWESRFPTALLITWKTDQVADYDEAVGGWRITDEEAAEVIEAMVEIFSLQAENITLGGAGGNAPGAGGGGGGAIGPGALAGPGGPGGRIDLRGKDAVAPGAGGGGGGFLASGAILLDPSLPRATEGKGFSTGADGQGGGETLISDGGTVLMRAAGGAGALAGSGVRMTSDRLAVSTLMLANYVEVTNGLTYVARGAWSNYSVLNVPSTAAFPVLVIVEAGSVPQGEYTIVLKALGPDDEVHSQVSFPVTVEGAGDVLRIPRVCVLETVIDDWGLWVITASTPLVELARIALLVKRTGEA